MNLEELNKEYVQLKKDLEKARKDIEKLEISANDLADDKTILKAKVVEAKRKKDKVAEEKLTESMKKVDEKIKTVQENAVKKKEEMKQISTKINSTIMELRINPEMDDHLNEVMTKKYSRKLLQLGKEKEELEGKKQRLVNLNQLVVEHPSLGNNLKGILGATQELKNLENELSAMIVTDKSGKISYKNPTRAMEIMNNLMPLAQQRIIANKEPLMDYIEKNKLEINENDIDELADRGFKVDGKGNIDLNATINKNISMVNKKIKSCDKSMRNYTIALKKIQRVQPEPTIESTPETTVEPEVEPTPVTPTVVAKPKWYQFVQRFKNWYNRTKQQLLPEAEEIEEIEEMEEVEKPEIHTNSENQRNAFSNSLKYEIVQDMIKEMQEKELKQAKKERKEEDKER